MDEVQQQGPTVWQFVRQYLGPTVIGLILVAIVYGAMTIVSPYLREKRTATKIEALGGTTRWWFRGPDWMIQLGGHNLPFFQRVIALDLTKAEGADLSRLRSDLDSLKFLNTLTLNGDQITDGRLEGLKGINLFNLLLEDMNDAELDQLPRFKKDLSCLYLEGPKITDKGMERLRGLTSLNILGIRGAKVTDVGLKHITKLTTLTSLELSNTPATDAGLEYLDELTSLTRLVLGGTQFTDGGLEHIKGLTKLTELQLYDTQTTPEGRGILRKALPNCNITPNP